MEGLKDRKGGEVRENKHAFHALFASLIFMVVWTPYRYLTSVLVSMNVQVRLVDCLVKPVVKFGISALCLKLLDGIPRGLYLKELGLKREDLFKGMLLGAIAWLFFTLAFQLMLILLSGQTHLALRYTVSDPISYLLDLSYYLLIVGLFEELFARGYVLRELHRGIGPSIITPVLVSAILFSTYHIPIDVFVKKLALAPLLSHLFVTFSFSILASYVLIKSGWQLASATLLHGLIDVKPFFSLVPPDLPLSGIEKLSAPFFFISSLASILTIEALYKLGCILKGSFTRSLKVKWNHEPDPAIIQS